jgi:hypothetical protein
MQRRLGIADLDIRRAVHVAGSAAAIVHVEG